MEVSYLAKVKILVIDDLPYTRSMVRQILKVLGGRNIKDAPDGAKALKIMKTFDPDLIILDWEMKPMNGIEFTRNVRDSEESSNPFVPIIMLSGYTNKDRIIEARDAGVTEYVIKPFSATSLYNRIQEVIDAPRPFIRIEGFFGPDRRRRETKIDYTDRRKKEPETDQAMNQDQIDGFKTPPAEGKEDVKGESSS